MATLLRDSTDTPGDRQLHLNTFGIGYGFHLASWLHPSVDLAQSWDLGHHQRVAALAERGLFDALFIQDGQGLSVEDPTIGGNGETKPEPLTILSALAATTERLGLASTFSTTYNEPYNIARFVASLDLLSKGRAGWNIVTSQKALDAANFGDTELPSHAERYRRSEEFVQVVKGLWDTWDADALVGDRVNRRLVDPSKVRRLNYEGEYFSVRGPLNVPRSPQGRPVLFQAGSSEIGREQGARHGDVIFTAQTDLTGAQDFYTDLKRRAVTIGRDPSQILIVPGLLPVIGSTDHEAQELVQFFNDNLDIDAGIAFWKAFTGLDLAGADLSKPIPDSLWDKSGRDFKSRVAVLRERANAESLTALEVLQKGTLGYGHFTTIGTPEKVADEIELWFKAKGADGFNVLSLISPASLEVFVDHVVPILQKKGIFRRDYTSETLRGHYGLAPL